MADYDLSKLSYREFEHLIQSLADREIGPGMVVFGDGPDGGREATFEGEILYPKKSTPWNGYGVVQAKFLQRPSGTKEDGDWVLGHLKSELGDYADPDKKRRKPDYFIFVTNARLTPVKDTGSKDKVLKRLKQFKEEFSLIGYALWDYDKIRTLLDNNADVRRAYAAFVTPGDVLSSIMEMIDVQNPDFEETICSFLQKELQSDEFVNLEQAGHGADERIPLARVFVDLHTRDQPPSGSVRYLENVGHLVFREHSSDSEHTGFIQQILEIASERLDPQTLAIHSAGPNHETGESNQTRGRFVLIGGPGQGKTTVGQFICQIFRASIISQRPDTTLSLETKSALSMIRTHCEEEGLNSSPVPRFPFRIVLNEFASALSGNSPQAVNSVFSYLANQIFRRAEREVLPEDLKRWLARYPSLFVFDGLDEVPSSSNRDQVLQSIRDFWVDVANLNADVLAIATSRPQGYNEDFSPEYYHHQWLVHLDKSLGNHFAERLVDVRYGTDADRKDKVLARLERAFESEATSRLMRTPLQVTIMTALVDRMGQPPQARWNLFKAYYDVIYQREVERDIPASELLRFYQPDINAIHNRVALLLQIDSERSGLTDARFSSQRFVSLVEKRLMEEGHVGEDLNGLKQKIVDAALERLVFLVGLESDQIGFEVRSLQEFMAAESLMEGSDEDIDARLREIAPIPNWRNVFLFASGKCFADRQHLRDKILSICTMMNEKQEDPLAGAYLVGSGLAIELIDDGLSRHQPKYVQTFARIALRALDAPNVQFHKQLSAIYEPQLGQVFSEEVTRRLNDSREIVKINVWNCLLHLVDAEIGWARDLAEKYWPSNTEEQLKLLNQVPDVPESYWATKRFLDLAPRVPVHRFREFFKLGPFQHQDLTPNQAAFIEALRLPRNPQRNQISFLETRVSYYPLTHLADNESSWIDRFCDMKDLHPTWDLFKSAARFLSGPTKECLARELRNVASSLDFSAGTRTFGAYLHIPWPLAACLDMCTEQTQALVLAERVASGALGDTTDWLQAENRWLEKGITSDDILYMSDERLPFDNKIGSLGFPTCLSVRPIAFYATNHALPRDILDLHRKLPESVSRSFVSRLVDAYFVNVSLGWPPHEPGLMPDMTVEDARLVYDDLPDGHSIPISLLASLLKHSKSEVVDFVVQCDRRGMTFRTFSPMRVISEDTLEHLRAFAIEHFDQPVLLPVLGALAENGELPKQAIEIPSFDQLEKPAYKAAALMVQLSTASWTTFDTDKLVAIVSETARETDVFYQRVFTTIRTNRLSGELVNRFLVRLQDVLPDSDHSASIAHCDLLEDLLRRRTSRFNDPTHVDQFNMPSGLRDLLIA